MVNSESDPRAEFRRHAGIFVLILVGIWVAFYTASRALPYVRSGHDLIYALKEARAREGVVFPQDVDAIRVVVFGDSRVQAGFKPELFDQLSAGRAYSFNMGLPNERRFMRELEALVRRDQAPDIVVLTVPWSTEAEPGLLERLGDDKYVLEQLLPFRTFPRDLALFAIRSATRGGLFEYYDAAIGFVESAERDRGYFFIEGMSHFLDHRLPDDFTLDIDDTTVAEPREVETQGPLFDRLVELKKQEGFEVVFAPTYYRATFRAPAPSDDAVKRALSPYGFIELDRHYWLYPNRLFSDPVHLNPGGADVYTRDLWNLLAPLIEKRRSAAPPD